MVSTRGEVDEHFHHIATQSQGADVAIELEEGSWCHGNGGGVVDDERLGSSVHDAVGWVGHGVNLEGGGDRGNRSGDGAMRIDTELHVFGATRGANVAIGAHVAG